MSGTDMIGHLPVIRCLPTVATAGNHGNHRHSNSLLLVS